MKTIIPITVLLILLIGGGALWFFSDSVELPVTPEANGIEGTDEEPVVSQEELRLIDEKRDLIYLETPQPGEIISSPLEIEGLARGYWYFEASFPIALLNRNGQTIARGIAEAQSDWMTEEFVPFKATLNFKSPYMAGDPQFLSHGNLVLVKDNPSGEPERDDSLRIPIQFAPNTEATPFSISIPTPVTIYDGIDVMDNIKILDLSYRGLNGSLKAEIRHLTKLEQLDLSGNEFNGLPAEVGQLSELRVLNLANNPFTGLPRELGNLSKLQVLDLRGTNYSHEDIAAIQSSWTQAVELITDESEAE